MVSQKVLFTSVACATLVAGILGLLLGHFVVTPEKKGGKHALARTAPRLSQGQVQEALLDLIDAKEIERFLSILTEKPHLAGTPQDKEQAEWVSSQWKQFGLDSVKIIPYDVLLSYPRIDKPNKIHVVDANGNDVFSTKGTQDPLWAEEESSPLVRPNFNAYSAPGSPEGDLVYVNYGRREDYDKLKELGISTEGKILLIKYGRIFRGNIAKFAEEHGGVGVVLFSDPKDFAREGRDKVYPHTVFMPGMAVQDGTIWLEDGDPLTPLYPSLESAFREDEDKVGLPKIPVQPIGYDEAEEFLKRMSGPDAPEDWQGGLSVKYKLGPGLTNGEKVKMEVYTSNAVSTTYNVIGVLRGAVEPDRYVLLGNHRDAWILGSVDPSSGTAAMMELARVFGKLKVDEGWRPRRSIVFCSWGAEEYGLIGSVEWTQENAKMLSSGGVVYLNVDMALEGNYSLRALGVPLAYQSLFDAAKVVPNPNPEEIQAGNPTVFDTWVDKIPSDHDPAVPRVRSVGSGSDYKGFMHNLGIPCVDVRYTYATDIGSYPLYHTLYETFNLVDLLMDQGFHYSKAVTQMWGELTRAYAESPLIPFKVEDYAAFLNREFTYIKDTYGQKLESNGVSLVFFESAVANFSSQAAKFQRELDALDTEDPFALRSANDRLLQVERSFLDPQGLPDRPLFNHIVFAPSSANSYAGTSFTGLSDLLYNIEQAADPVAAWKGVKKHMSVIAYLVQAAAQTMSGELNFRGE